MTYFRVLTCSADQEIRSIAGWFDTKELANREAAREREAGLFAAVIPCVRIDPGELNAKMAPQVVE